MAYLAALFSIFLGGMVTTAVVLALLSTYLFGYVQEWVLFASLAASAMGAHTGATAFEHWFLKRDIPQRPRGFPPC